MTNRSLVRSIQNSMREQRRKGSQDQNPYAQGLNLVQGSLIIAAERLREKAEGSTRVEHFHLKSGSVDLASERFRRQNNLTPGVSAVCVNRSPPSSPVRPATSMEPSKGYLRTVAPQTRLTTAPPPSALYDRGIEYLYGRINYERTAETAPYPFRLRRMNALLDRLELRGIAGGRVPVVHIAGTKGKGSTATMVAAMLSAGGFRTGLYTSPHLQRLEERFVVNGAMPDPDQVVDLIDAVRCEADRLATGELGEPTFFELTTAMALLHFRNRDCHAVVLEVGLGGKLDCTNVCLPAVTAITSIGFDHQHILGHTLGEIATQKAGIIKTGVPVVSGVSQLEARHAIAAAAAAKGTDLFAIGQQFECRLREPDADPRWRTGFDLVSHETAIKNRAGWTVPLDGAHQAANAALACVILDLLAASGTGVSLADQQQGLAQMQMLGRVERFALRPGVDVILDTAHNVDSIAALCSCIQRRKAGRPVTVVFGTSRDKEHQRMLALLSAQADRMVLTRYHGNPRYRDPLELLPDIPPGPRSVVVDDPLAAVVSAAQQEPGPHLIVVCGSFFLAAEVRPLLIELANDPAGLGPAPEL